MATEVYNVNKIPCTLVSKNLFVPICSVTVDTREWMRDNVGEGLMLYTRDGEVVCLTHGRAGVNYLRAHRKELNLDYNKISIPASKVKETT